MNEPIKSGDRCIIIDGFRGPKSPNVGKRVTAGVTVAEHPDFGRMVRIYGHDLVIENRPNADECNIPTAWLRKIPPVAPEVPAMGREVTA